jgi:hypothetical protein
MPLPKLSDPSHSGATFDSQRITRTETVRSPAPRTGSAVLLITPTTPTLKAMVQNSLIEKGPDVFLKPGRRFRAATVFAGAFGLVRVTRSQPADNDSGRAAPVGRARRRSGHGR